MPKEIVKVNFKSKFKGHVKSNFERNIYNSILKLNCKVKFKGYFKIKL